MGAQLGSRGKAPAPEINVTPLVDVVLVLLIIFMVVAPAINEGEHLDLPRIFAPDPKPRDLAPIELTLARNGRIILEQSPVTRAEVRARLQELHRGQPQRELLLKMDSELPYHEVRALLGELQDLGFKGLSLKVVERKPQGA